MTTADGQGSPFPDWMSIYPVWKGHTPGLTPGKPGVGMKESCQEPSIARVYIN
jgi:hypothetical protein